jgi:hypothetical protein
MRPAAPIEARAKESTVTVRRGWKLAGAGLVCVPALVVLGAVTPMRALANTAVACSSVALVTAITTANAASGGTLDLASGCTYTYSAANNTTDLPGTATPVITTNITINGNGATVTRSSGSPAFRLFDVSTTGTFTLNNTTVSNGSALGNGGGIADFGALTLSADTITGNTGSGVNQIFGSAGLTATNTVFSNNTQHGLFNQGAGFDTLVGITANNNSFDGVLSNGAVSISGAAIGGNHWGVQTVNASSAANAITVTNSTLTDNSNVQILSEGAATVTGTTIAGTTAIGVFGLGTTVVTDSILASNGGASCGVPVTDGGNNVVFPASDVSCPTTFIHGDPKLDILRDNGGPTQTMALLGGSAAAFLITAGATGCTAPGTDQRGVPRLQNGQACDAGAFELDSTSTAVVPSATSLTVGQPLSLAGIVTPFSFIPGAPSGTLSFFNGGILVATVALINGHAADGPLTLPVGTYTVVALFPGARGFLASGSAAVTVTISPTVPAVGSAPEVPSPIAPVLLVLGGLGLIGAVRRSRRR